MKSLVTGASGYIGRNLVQKMEKREMRAKAFVRKTSYIQSLLKLENVEVCFGDITDLSSVEQAVEGRQVVYHLAGLVSDWGGYKKFYEANYLGTKNVLEASIRAKVKKFIYISSIGVLNLKGKGAILEDQLYSHFPSSYCRSKAEAEKLVRKLSSSIPIVIIRPTVVYGPGDRLCTSRILNFARKNLLFVVDQGKGIFPHLYIDNLTEAILLAAEKEEAIGEIFNITDGVNTPVGEFFNYLSQIAGKGNILISFSYPVAWCLAFLMDVFTKLTGKPPLLSWMGLEFLSLKCRFDIFKARETLGYKPSIPLKEGMKIVKRWWESAS